VGVVAGTQLATQSPAAAAFTLSNGYAVYSGGASPISSVFNVTTLASGGTADASTLQVISTTGGTATAQSPQNGFITFTPPANSTTNFTVTYALCPTGQSTSCPQAQIVFAPPVETDMQYQVPIIGGTADQTVGMNTDEPATLPKGSTVTFHVGAEPASIPASDSGFTINYGTDFLNVIPVPAGLSFVSASLQGGDPLSSAPGKTTVMECTAWAQSGCVAQQGGTSGHMPAGMTWPTTLPYIQVLASAQVPGGQNTSFPTAVLTFQVTGNVGTQLPNYLTQFSTTVNVAVGSGLSETIYAYQTSNPLFAFATSSIASAGPSVTGLNPTSGPITGGTSVDVAGTNFTGATAVDFGNTPATSFTVNSATDITAVAPPSAATGTVHVTVTSPSGTSQTSPADQYTYNPVPPGAPTNVVAVATNSSGQVNVNWTAPTDTGGGSITGYTLTPNPACATCTGLSVGNTTSTTVNGLTNFQAYTFTVTASNSAGPGPASAPSNSVTPTPAATVPDPPTNLTAAATGTSGEASVSWTAPFDGGAPITSYTLTPSPACPACTGLTVSGSSTTATVDGLTDGTPYTFTAVATNIIGSSNASQPSNQVVTGQAPGAPTIGTAAATGNSGEATVSWTPGSSGTSAITSYTVTPSPACPGCTGLTTSGSATSATVEGLTDGTPYTFTVTATNVFGTGPPSAASNSVSTGAAPTAPTNPVATATGHSGEATLTWTGSNFFGQSPSYTITPSPACGGCTGLTTTSTSATIEGLTDGTPYTFTVTADNSFGMTASVPSNQITTFQESGAPGPPTAVTATATGNSGEVSVSWTPGAFFGSGPTTQYTLTPSPACSGCTGLTVTGNPAGTSTLVEGLTNGKAYTFTVTATNVAGTSTPSSPSNSVTPTAPPGAPTNVVGTVVGSAGFIRVTWTAPPNNGATISQYTITPSPACPGCHGLTVTGNPPIGNSAVTGLTPGQPYTFTVTATNSAGTGPASAPSAPATPVGPPSAPGDVIAAGTGQTGKILVSWQQPSSNGSALTGYTVHLSPACAVCSGLSPGKGAVNTTITGLTDGTPYTITITASNGYGTGPASTPTTATSFAKPGTATNLVAAVTGNSGEVTVNWTAAPDNGSPITTYTVVPTPTCAACTGLSPMGTSTTIDGLTNGTSYQFHVYANNAAGSGPPSKNSNVVVPSTAPSAPTNVALVAGNGTAQLSWTVGANGGGKITSWVLTPTVNGIVGPPVTISSGLAGGALDPTPGANDTWLWRNLTNGDSYSATLSQVNAVGTSPASPSTATVVPAAVPDIPSAVTTTPGDGQVSLTWVVPANGGSPITSFTITVYKSGTAQPPIVLAAGPPGSNLDPTPGVTDSYAVTGLTNGGSYQFSVAATNAVGNGLPSSLGTPVTPFAGYWVATNKGNVIGFGQAGYYGSMAGQTLNKPIVGVAGTPDGLGYWLVASDGGIFAFGDARYFGSTGNLTLNAPIVGMATTPDGLGYWLVASDGGIFAFGDANYYGSMGGKPLNKPIVGMAVGPSGSGYWLVASDGGIFAFNVPYYGSMGGKPLNKPIVGMAVGPSGSGYWLVASDGGIFAFNVPNYGSAVPSKPASPVAGMATTQSAQGYWITTQAAVIYNFGDAQAYKPISGSPGGTVVGIASMV
jgi:titin